MEDVKKFKYFILAVLLAFGINNNFLILKSKSKLLFIITKFTACVRKNA